MSVLLLFHPVSAHSSAPQQQCPQIFRLYSTVCCSLASSSFGVFQTYLFEPEPDSQEKEEQLLLQGSLQVYVSEW